MKHSIVLAIWWLTFRNDKKIWDSYLQMIIPMHISAQSFQIHMYMIKTCVVRSIYARIHIIDAILLFIYGYKLQRQVVNIHRSKMHVTFSLNPSKSIVISIYLNRYAFQFSSIEILTKSTCDLVQYMGRNMYFIKPNL